MYVYIIHIYTHTCLSDINDRQLTQRVCNGYASWPITGYWSDMSSATTEELALAYSQIWRVSLCIHVIHTDAHKAFVQNHVHTRKCACSCSHSCMHMHAHVQVHVYLLAIIRMLLKCLSPTATKAHNRSDHLLPARKTQWRAAVDEGILMKHLVQQPIMSSVAHQDTACRKQRLL
jgi:hypothetical protein